MKMNINGLVVEICDLDKSNMDPLAHELSQWQQANKFMRFVKDKPVSPAENIYTLEKSIANQHNMHKIIVEEKKQEILGFLVLDAFDVINNSLESYMRVNPKFKGMGIGTQGRKGIIEDLLSKDLIKKIISFHSAFNSASFVINRRSGFKLVDFLPDETFLPNICDKTDDFKREIDREQVDKSKGEFVDMDIVNRAKIMKGIHKHDLLDLLRMDR